MATVIQPIIRFRQDCSEKAGLFPKQLCVGFETQKNLELAGQAYRTLPNETFILLGTSYSSG